MAKERKKIKRPSSTNQHDPDELDKLLADGWEVKFWRYDAIDQCAEYMLEREVPDHA